MHVIKRDPKVNGRVKYQKLMATIDDIFQKYIKLLLERKKIIRMHMES